MVLTVPRQVAMYLIRDLLGYSLAHIGRLFGDRDHSTVIHSIHKVENTMSVDAEFRQTVEGVRDEIERGSIRADAKPTYGVRLGLSSHVKYQTKRRPGQCAV